MKTKVNFLLSLPVTILSAGIIIASHQPDIRIHQEGFVPMDKALHLTAYFIYGISVIIALSPLSKRLSSGKFNLLVLAVGFIFALSDEIHQSFVPGRQCEIWDWIADCTGILLALPLRKYLLKLTMRIVAKQENE